MDRLLCFLLNNKIQLGKLCMKSEWLCLYRFHLDKGVLILKGMGNNFQLDSLRMLFQLNTDQQYRLLERLLQGKMTLLDMGDRVHNQ